ncbi:MAG: amino acid permease [Anaerohalosphaeraceae bacterium]|jgi:amino acid transporter/mannitol/fructose-specific phosphotransferase system IIA component (Ntr-type)
MGLKKQLNLLDVFCIASGAMISSGIFILPGLAFSYAGPAVFISYLLAGVLALIGVLSVIELSTAMPKAGGDYYFVTRSMGPLVGTVSGVMSWFALSLKTAFAVFGIAEVVFLLTGTPILVTAAIVCAAFAILNIIGVEAAAKLEVYLVIGLLAILGIYCFVGKLQFEPAHFRPFLPQGTNSVLSTAGFVFVAYGGLLNVATISEEVKNPKRNIPLGFLLSVLVITVLYTVVLIITVGVMDPQRLSGSLSPIADAAEQLSGKPGYILVTAAAFMAFITTANAGIMSASRYPLALSRDKLLPRIAGFVHKRYHTPVFAVGLTSVFIFCALLLDIELLVKAASTVILTANVLAALAVIIMRHSKVVNYQPSFRVPFYPVLPIIGMLFFIVLIVDMGLASIEISLGLLAASVCMYVFYGRKQAQIEYALLHLIEQVTAKELTTHALESELREILHQRDEVIDDPFDKIVKEASVLDLDGPMSRKDCFAAIAEKLALRVSCTAEQMVEMLQQRESESTTAVSSMVAIPHLVIEGEGVFRILIARCKEGVRFSDRNQAVKAIFVIVGTKDQRTLHLKSLAAIAQIVQSAHFEQYWQQVRTTDQLQDILFLSERKRFHFM